MVVYRVDTRKVVLRSVLSIKMYMKPSLVRLVVSVFFDDDSIELERQRGRHTNNNMTPGFISFIVF